MKQQKQVTGVTLFWVILNSPGLETVECHVRGANKHMHIECSSVSWGELPSGLCFVCLAVLLHCYTLFFPKKKHTVSLMELSMLHFCKCPVLWFVTIDHNSAFSKRPLTGAQEPLGHSISLGGTKHPSPAWRLGRTDSLPGKVPSFPLLQKQATNGRKVIRYQHEGPFHYLYSLFHLHVNSSGVLARGYTE